MVDVHVFFSKLGLEFRSKTCDKPTSAILIFEAAGFDFAARSLGVF